MRHQFPGWHWPVITLCLLLANFARAAELRIAVASNFAPVLEQLADKFHQQSGDNVVLSAGASGRLYSQISNDAPFDLYFSADNDRPSRLVHEHKAVPDTVFTYALGRMMLWSPTLTINDNPEALLAAGNFHRLALANPKLAPYGAAAQQVLTTLKLWDQLQPKLVTGENISQTLQFIESGNAELGFIAQAQWLELKAEQRGQPWLIPDNLHAPIIQDAVILRDSAAARAFMVFIQSDVARTVIADAGYSLP